MEKKYTFNLKDGMVSFETEKLKGCLKAILMICEDKTDIKIISEYGYDVLDIQQFNGVDYMPIRFRGIDSKGHGINYGNYELQLNEKLQIILSGMSNKEVTLIFRLE